MTHVETKRANALVCQLCWIFLLKEIFKFRNATDIELHEVIMAQNMTFDKIQGGDLPEVSALRVLSSIITYLLTYLLSIIV